MRLVPELKSKIDQLWDKFWSGGLSNPLLSIEQMSYLIFMNRLEERDMFEQKMRKQTNSPTNQSSKGRKTAGGLTGSISRQKKCSSMYGIMFSLSSRTSMMGKRRFLHNT
jgi:hypothetical protein